MKTDDTLTPPESWINVPVIALVARILCRELVLQNEYLRTENRILKSKVSKRLSFTDYERRTLVDAATALGKKLMNDIVSIVRPETILAWQRKLERQKWDYSDHRKKHPGRPRIAADIEGIVCRMARENIWGYARIQRELEKLDITISKTTVANILRRNGLPPSPERKGLTWREFLSRHAKLFLYADFFTKEVWTHRGLTTVFVFFVIHLKSRKLIFARATISPNSRWLIQQLRHVLWQCDDDGIDAKYFLRDNGSCYSSDCDLFLKSANIKVVHTPLQAPNANSHAERFVLSIKRECLNQLLIVGISQLQRVIDDYKIYFNNHRPHQGIGNTIPSGNLVFGTHRASVPRRIECQTFIGGLLKSYRRVA